MSTVTKQPTANETPDSGQGGSAVTGPINTGHASTTASATGGASQVKTCKWTGFVAPGHGIITIILKVDWSESGITEGGGRTFKCDYSLNGGSNWTNLFNHSPLAVNSGTAQASLARDQIISQIQVRDLLQADSIPEGSESVTGTISNIRLEIMAQDPQIIMIM